MKKLTLMCSLSKTIFLHRYMCPAINYFFYIEYLCQQHTESGHSVWSCHSEAAGLVMTVTL